MSNNPSSGSGPRPGGLSLYANLLDPSSSAAASTPADISKAPVLKANLPEGSANDEAAKKQQINAAALRFQPTVKRPQLAAQKSKPKPSFPKAVVSDSTNAPNSASRPAQQPVKTTLADWTATGDDDDVNGFYVGEKRQRGGRKRRKKNREEYAVAQDWDDIYDPSRPNNYEDYIHSDEKVREVREWKDRLYAHRIARKQSSDLDSDEEESYRPRMGNQFAPPTNYSFAPPPIDSPSKAPPPPPVELPDDKTGEDAYERRLRLSQAGSAPQPSPSPPRDIVPPPPPPLESSAPAATISRAPVRYNLPPPPAEIPASETELEEALAAEPREDSAEPGDAEDEPRSRRPGQKGFAERLMSKYGWSKGSGLGASGRGIINPLQVKVEKRKKKPDSEGGGFVEPSARGKIVGGKKKNPEDDVGKFGHMSEVVLLRGMVDGMDLDEELGDGGLMQEIGDECGEKYGNVERVYIDRSDPASAKVFVKFTSQLSALRAVNALEGRIFSGNTITARFFDTEKFEDGVYDA